jgi:WD40 repeat protein
LTGHTNNVVSVTFSPNGRRLASASHVRTVKVWDVASGRADLTLKEDTNVVAGVAFSPDGRTLASGRGDTTVRQWDAATGK